MTRTFENPANGYRESVNTVTVFLCTLLFGLFYLAVRGLWTHVVLVLLLIVVSLALWPLGIFIMVVVWLAYAFAAPGIVARSYGRRGWREVSASAPPEPAKPWPGDSYKPLQRF